MSGYVCKECGAEVAVSPDGGIQRSCEHTGTILAMMEATITIPLSILEQRPEDRFLKFFNDIGVKLMERVRGVR